MDGWGGCTCYMCRSLYEKSEIYGIQTIHGECCKYPVARGHSRQDREDRPGEWVWSFFPALSAKI